MSDATRTQELLTQFAARTVENMTAWSEAGHRVLNELVDLGAATARESLRFWAEAQRAGIDALRQSQGSAARWQATAGQTDPVAWYRTAVTETVAGAERALRLAEENVQALTRTMERLQTTTTEAGRDIQETVAAALGRTREIYSNV